MSYHTTTSRQERSDYSNAVIVSRASVGRKGKVSSEPGVETLLTIPFQWVSTEGEFIASLGGQPCIVDSGSYALVFDLGHGNPRSTDQYEQMKYGSETLWCTPMHADIKVADGTTHRVESHRVAQRSKKGPRHAGIMGLAWCAKTKAPSATGMWKTLTPGKRASRFPDSVWSLVPSADHVRLDAREEGSSLRWLTDKQALVQTPRPLHAVDILYFNHVLSDGRTLQFIGWRTPKDGKRVLFETGCTYSRKRMISDTVPPSDLVFGNIDMRGKRFWFDLKRGKAFVDDTGEGLLARLPA